MCKVPEHKHREERFVDNFLHFRVLRKVAAGGIDDEEVDESH